MDKRKIKALLLSRDSRLADKLNRHLRSLDIRVLRTASLLHKREHLDRMYPVNPYISLLIIDGRDYADLLSGDREEFGLPILLLSDAKSLDRLKSPFVVDEVVLTPIRGADLRFRVENALRHSLPDVKAGSFVSGVRLRGQFSPARKPRPILKVDEDRYEIRLGEEPLDLTFREYELLKYLLTRPGRTFTREELLAYVWGENYLGGTRTVDVHIRRLRMKLERVDREFIRTVRSVGYKFVG